jgi:hypothetical protein
MSNFSDYTLLTLSVDKCVGKLLKMCGKRGVLGFCDFWLANKRLKIHHINQLVTGFF